jgi:hypothetical protein
MCLSSHLRVLNFAGPDFFKVLGPLLNQAEGAPMAFDASADSELSAA